MSGDSQEAPIAEMRDRRVDRALSFGLATVCSVALSVGAYFFKGLSAELRELNKAVAELRTEVRVQAERERRVEELAKNVETLGARVTRLEIQAARPR